MSNNALNQTPSGEFLRIDAHVTFKNDRPFMAWLRELAGVVDRLNRERWGTLVDCTESFEDDVSEGFVVYKWLEGREKFLSAQSGILKFERTQVMRKCEEMIKKHGIGGGPLEPAAKESHRILWPIWHLEKPTERRPSEVELYLAVQPDVGGKQAAFTFRLAHFLFSRKSYPEPVDPEIFSLYAETLVISEFHLSGSGRSRLTHSHLDRSRLRLGHSHGGTPSLSSMQQMTAQSSNQPDTTTQASSKGVLSEVGMVRSSTTVSRSFAANQFA